MNWSFKKLLKSAPIQLGIASILAFYCRLVYFLTPWTHFNKDIPLRYLAAQKPFIVCFWHGRLMMLPFAWSPKGLFFSPFFMLISRHSDGKLISRVVHLLGIETVSGSSNKGGDQAFRDILRHLKKNHIVGITPDGPKGPAKKVKLGIIHAAYYGSCDIIPVTFSTSCHRIWKSWDSFLWAFPSKRGCFVWGTPIKPPKNKTLSAFEETKQLLENEMHRITEFADTHCHRIKPS